MTQRSRKPETGPARVAFATFGCKLNQWDTQNLHRGLAGRYEIVDFGRRADLYVINTCTVTSGSDCQARQLIRRTVRRHPGAKLLVTGCYAERARSELLSMEGVTGVLGNAEKERLPGLIGEYLAPVAGAALKGGAVGKDARIDGHRGDARVRRSRRSDRGPGIGRSRAQVAIQQGCDRGCTYCIVPSVRGRPFSYAPERVLAEVEALLDDGYREIVLTGTYLGDYGGALSPPMDLPGLIKRLDGIVGGSARLRISSLGPSDITDELIEVVSGCRSVCRHFHVAFQSGDDGVLTAMGRDYGGSGLRRALELITGSFSDCGLGGDVMVGFPGEDEAAFLATKRVVEDYPFSYLHVFVFSPRPGTVAEGLGGAVHPGLAAERSFALRELSTAKGLDFASRFLGRRIEVIAEGPSEKDGELVGTSEEYLRACFKGDQDWKGSLIPVDVSAVLSARKVRGWTPALQTSRLG